MGPIREIEHAADLAFRVEGRNLRELFENAAGTVLRAQNSVHSGPVRITRDVHVTGVDRETLLVNWLNELLYLQEKYSEIYDHCHIASISGTDLRAKVQGTVGSMRTQIKAVTFHNLSIERLKDGLKAVIVIDV